MANSKQIGSTQNGALSKNSNLSQNPILTHIAIIMDGNGRWAEKRGLSIAEGHYAGAKVVRLVVEEAKAAGLRYLTLFAFSTENWRRPKDEVAALLKLFQLFISTELEQLIANGVRLRAIGNRAQLPRETLEVLEAAEAKSRHCSDLQLVLALSYGGRDEIVCASRKLAADVARGVLKVEEIDEERFAHALFAPDIPDPELLIRTSNEQRLSNFLLWQLAYTEILITPTLWPDFTREEFRNCLQEFAGRKRRYGMR